MFFAITASAKLAAFTGFDSLGMPGQGAMVLEQGDIDGDGLKDWVTDDKFSGRILVLLNKRFGNTMSKRLETSVYTINSLALGDADGDRKLDILAGGESYAHDGYTQTLSLIFAGADLGYGDSLNINIGESVKSACFTDVNLDGKQDIVVLSSSLKWCENKNGGASWAMHDIDTGSELRSGSEYWIQVADFDMDSAADFVVGFTGDMGDGRLLFFRNNANGTFTKKVIATNLDSKCCAVGDINFDGMPDLFLGKYIFINNRGVFTKDSIKDPTEHQADGVAIGDVNNDGYPDLACGLYNDGVFLWQSISRGVYARSSVASMGNSKRVAIADADGDHFADIVSLSENNGVLGFAGNVASHVFQPETLAAVKGLNCFDVVDLNKDGMTDLVTSPFRVFQRQVLTISAAQKDTILVKTDSSSGGATGYGFADFDKDGLQDIAALGSASLAWAKQADLSHFTWNELHGVNMGPMGIADLDGNGAVDFVGRYYSSVLTPAKSILVGFLNDGAGNFTKDTLLSVWGNASDFPLALCDFNGDGKVDIITVSNERTLENTYLALVGINKGSGSFDSTYIDFGNASSLVAIAPFDVDKDGRLDLLLASGDFRLSHILGGPDSAGRVNRVTIVLAQGGSGNNEIAAGDIDKDGKNDILIYKASTKYLYWMSQDTALGFISMHSISSGKVTGNIRLADFDNDGWLDVLCMEGDQVVMYRNLLGVQPATPGKPPTHADLSAQNVTATRLISKPRNVGLGKFQWDIKGVRGPLSMDFFLMNGQRINVPVTGKTGCSTADLRMTAGLVVWIFRDRVGTVVGRGVLPAIR